MNERAIVAAAAGKMICKRALLGLWPATLALLLLGGLWATFGLARPAAADGPWYVDAATGDDGNDCLSPASACATVGAAVDKAVSGDTIYVAAGVYSAALSFSDMTLTFIGAGSGETVLDGGGVARVIYANSSNLVLSGMTIRNGATEQSGGGVFVNGSVAMDDVVLRDNSADGTGGGLRAGGSMTLTNVLATGNAANYGGALYLSVLLGEGNVQLEKVTVADNVTGIGGALQLRNVDGPITNTTVSGNSGIGVYAEDFANITMTHGTIADNGGIGLAHENNSNVRMQNNVVAGNNGAGDNCERVGNLASTMVSLGGNVEDGDSCDFDDAGDQVNVEPILEALADNGGGTPTRGLAPGSPAIDAATAAGCAATDQRGVVRPQEGDGTPPAECDSGAFEYAEIGVVAVAISAPANALVESSVTIEATASPDTANRPVTYTWTADGQTAVTHSGGVTDSVTFSWSSAGVKNVSVSADNGLGESSDSVQVEIQEGVQAVTGVTIGGPTVGNAGEIYTFTAETAPADATLPVTYTWQIDGQGPVTHVGGLSHALALSWPDAGVYTLTVTAANAAGSAAESHTIALTAWYVDAAGGDDGNDCQTPASACETIQAALDRAPAGAVIHLAAGTYSERVTIEQAAELIGAGAEQTTLTSGDGPILSVGDGELGRFDAYLAGVTIQNGPEEGIVNEENLVVADSVIADNGSHGIENYGSLAVSRSAIRGNGAASGAALLNSGRATVNGVTISGNTSDNSIVHTLGDGGDTSLINVTVSGNYTGTAVTSANDGTTAVLNSTIAHNEGGGVASYATLTLQNTVLADNEGSNCWTAVSSLGHNVVDDDTCELDGEGDLESADPLLGPLADNGGPTMTHLPAVSSPAIDAGDSGACPATDQRGEARPFDGDEDGTAVCDVGAVEVVSGDGYVILLPAVTR